MNDWCTGDGDAVLVRLKAVPSAKRPGVAGLLADRLKVKVSQAPEGGKANRAIIETLADRLGVPANSVTLVEGAASPAKVVRIEGVTTDAVRGRLCP